MKRALVAASMFALACASDAGLAFAQAPAENSPRSGYLEPLSAENSVLILVDLQEMFGLTISSINQTNLVNNAVGIAKAAEVFGVPTILATASAKSFAGPFFPQVTAARKDLNIYDRTAINLWNDGRVVEEVRRTGRKKIVIGGLWTASCVMLPALSALADGYQVYVLTDVSADIDPATHEHAIQRLIQAGATPVSWIALMLEWQRDWVRKQTAVQVIDIGKRYGGAWGMAATYASDMKVGADSK
ncbi:isochorismatase family protein [Xanthobacter sp. KR7-225]|uniref:isochorismatase family protein n=1 Tax=Xanthobacter sp. KR7-225 TaxID=3156613 RepID=UPI0032B4E876